MDPPRQPASNSAHSSIVSFRGLTGDVALYRSTRSSRFLVPSSTSGLDDVMKRLSACTSVVGMAVKRPMAR